MVTTKKKRPLCTPIKCDRIAFELPKGKREAYKMAAREFGISFSKLIQNGVEEYIKNHGEEFVAEYKDKKTATK